MFAGQPELPSEVHGVVAVGMARASARGRNLNLANNATAAGSVIALPFAGDQGGLALVRSSEGGRLGPARNGSN
jgi:hypothetical protein